MTAPSRDRLTRRSRLGIAVFHLVFYSEVFNMKVAFFGPPGVGKGTHAKEIARQLGFPHISTGALLRDIVASGSPADLAAKVEPIMKSGGLVPDDLVNDLVAHRLGEPDAQMAFGLDGFPRTEAQAIWLDAFLAARQDSLTHVLLLEADRDELKRRLALRAQTENRPDDTPEVHEARIQKYEEEAGPVIAHYERDGRLIRVDAMGTIDEVRARILAALTPSP